MGETKNLGNKSGKKTLQIRHSSLHKKGKQQIRAWNFTFGPTKKVKWKTTLTESNSARVKKWSTLSPLWGQKMVHIYPLKTPKQNKSPNTENRSFLCQKRFKDNFETKILISGPHWPSKIWPKIWTTYSAWCGPLIDLLTKLSAPQLKNWNTTNSAFEEHTYKPQKKNKNTIIFTFGNATAPFDFTWKLFHFLPSPFLICFQTKNERKCRV